MTRIRKKYDLPAHELDASVRAYDAMIATRPLRPPRPAAVARNDPPRDSV